jgi:hypothetical protein
MLYGLVVRHRNEALSGAAGERNAQWDSEEMNREDRCWSIVRRAAQAEYTWVWVGVASGVNGLLFQTIRR